MVLEVQVRLLSVYPLRMRYHTCNDCYFRTPCTSWNDAEDFASRYHPESTQTPVRYPQSPRSRTNTPARNKIKRMYPARLPTFPSRCVHGVVLTQANPKPRYTHSIVSVGIRTPCRLARLFPLVLRGYSRANTAYHAHLHLGSMSCYLIATRRLFSKARTGSASSSQSKSLLSGGTLFSQPRESHHLLARVGLRWLHRIHT